MSEIPTPRTDAAVNAGGFQLLNVVDCARQLERELIAEKAAADAAKKVIASKEWTDSEACALMLVRKARSEHDALATQVAMLREALENIQVLSHVAYDRSATKNVLIRRKNNALVAKINDTASVALSATPETKHPDTLRLDWLSTHGSTLSTYDGRWELDCMPNSYGDPRTAIDAARKSSPTS